MFRTRAQNSSLFQEPKSPWLAHSIGDATQNIAKKKKKKRTLLDKITSLQKYKQEGLKQTTFVCSSLKINEQVNELCEGKLEKKNNNNNNNKQREFWTKIFDSLHWPGIEPGPPAWQARILPLNHQCLSMVFHLY